MNKDHIISEIRRTAHENGGVALGMEKFADVTGISVGLWRGKFWRRWSEAVRDAGLVENKLREAHPREFLVECLARLTRKNARFPTYADVRMERVCDPTFPNHQAFNRLGSRELRVDLVRQLALANPAFADVLGLLPASNAGTPSGRFSEEEELGEGFVYMLKAIKYYKIGKTLSVPRRHREIALELPEKPDVVHAIRTDDPTGIEAYWHARFAARRANGEWFVLTPADVRAFKRRKFM